MSSSARRDLGIEVAGAVLSVLESGDRDGAPVVQLSGGPGCERYLPEALPGSGVRLFTPDARGVGESTGGAHDVTRAIADLEAIREAAGLRRWVVAGHSWGADLALAYALAHPDRVSRLLYVCGKGPHADRTWSEAYEAQRADDQAPVIPYSEEVHQALSASNREWIHRPRLWAEIAALPVPTDIVVADRDIRPSWPAAQLAEAIPDARLTTIAGRHDFWFDDPALWRGLITESVDRVDAQRPRQQRG